MKGWFGLKNGNILKTPQYNIFTKVVYVQKQVNSKGVRTKLLTLQGAENLILRKAHVFNLSFTGFKLCFNYKDLIPRSLKFQVKLHSLWNKHLSMYLPDMNMDLEGKVIIVQNIGKGNFVADMEFCSSVPSYWHECLFDLWPLNNIQKTSHTANKHLTIVH